jgi:Fur family ferric uptake transcriptional regulator
VGKSAANPPDIGALKQIIREAGLKSTGARLAVYRLMHEVDAPITHNDASERLAGLGFDHATIYRNLTDLTEAGLLVRTDLGDHVWRFELRRGDDDHKARHPHFLCTDCGTVECLPDQAVSVKPTAGAPKALKKRGVVVQVQGRCDDCEREAPAGG